MAELMDLDGPWSMELIETMIPVALEIKADRKSDHFDAVMAGAGALFSKTAVTNFRRQISKTKTRLRQLQRRGKRGSGDVVQDSAQELMSLMAELPLKGKGR